MAESCTWGCDEVFSVAVVAVVLLLVRRVRGLAGAAAGASAAAAVVVVLRRVRVGFLLSVLESATGAV